MTAVLAIAYLAIGGVFAGIAFSDDVRDNTPPGPGFPLQLAFFVLGWPLVLCMAVGIEIGKRVPPK